MLKSISCIIIDLLYYRVSTNNQKNRGNLDRQVSNSLNKIALMNPNNLEIFLDVGFRINNERKNFKTFLNKILSGEVDRVFGKKRESVKREIDEVLKDG